MLFNAGQDIRNKRLDLARERRDGSQPMGVAGSSGGARRERRAGAGAGHDERRELPAGDERRRGFPDRSCRKRWRRIFRWSAWTWAMSPSGWKVWRVRAWPSGSRRRSGERWRRF